MAENRFGIKSSGTTVSSNQPVGTAGQPAKTDAASVSGNKMPPQFKRGKPNENKSAAIARRMDALKKGKK